MVMKVKRDVSEMCLRYIVLEAQWGLGSVPNGETMG